MIYIGLFDKFRKAEKRDIDLMELISNGNSDVSYISEQQALNIAMVASCINFISNSIASMPIKLYKYENNNTAELSESEDNRVFLLNSSTGDTLSPYEMIKAFVADYLINGRGYIYINRKGNDTKSLHYVQSGKITTLENNDPIFKSYDIQVNGRKYRDFEFIKILRNTKDGITGKGILAENPLLLNIMLSAYSLEKNTYANNGKRGGIAKTPNKLDEPTLKRVRQAYKNWINDNSNSLIVLDNGLELIQNQATALEMQLSANKSSNAKEICSLFNLSQDVLSGNADNDKYFTTIKIAIMPIVKTIETALNRDLLLLDEQKAYYFAFDTSELLRGDETSRINAYNAAISGGWLTKNEARYKLDLEKIDGLDTISCNLGDVVYDINSKTYFTPNTNKVVTSSQTQGGDNIEN